MTWTNPLDRLPQVPQDYANHIIYGSSAVVLIACGVPPSIATVALVAANAAKKVVDYFKEGESLSMCIGKSLVGGVWGASVWVMMVIRGFN
jgi:hypothetical protein